MPQEDIPPLIDGQAWDHRDVTNRRFVIPATLSPEQRHEMHSRAKYYFSPNHVRERLDRRYPGTGCLTKVYPFGTDQNWVFLHLNLETDLALRQDSFPAGTRQVSTSCAAVKSFVKGNSSILVLIPGIEDFVTASAALSAIEPQKRPQYHMGASYLTGQPRLTLQTPTLLGRAGMLVQACMENTALGKSPMFRDGGKFSEADDFDPTLFAHLKAFRTQQGRTAGGNMTALLEESQGLTGDARQRAILTGIQLDLDHEGREGTLRNVVRKCLKEAKAARGLDVTVTDDEVTAELQAVADGIAAARDRGAAAAGAEADNDDEGAANPPAN